MALVLHCFHMNVVDLLAILYLGEQSYIFLLLEYVYYPKSENEHVFGLLISGSGNVKHSLREGIAVKFYVG